MNSHKTELRCRTNANNGEYATLPTNLVAMLQHQINSQGDNVAVISKEKRLTYRQLGDKAANIAALLHQLDAQANEYIGLYIEPSADLISAVWGSLYAGCGYLPLSPEYPAKRIEYMLKDGKARIVITQQHLKAQLAAMVDESVFVIAIEEVSCIVHFQAEVMPNDLAYMIYTSGSTGDPKGVMIEHHSIAAQMQWLTQFGFTAQDRILQKTPFSFDAAQWELLANAIGMTIVASEAGMYRNPAALIDSIIENQVSVLQCVPTLLQALLDSPGIQLCDSLTMLFSGGEILTKQLAAQCLNELQGRRLINLYGPTECTINASSYEVTLENLPDSPAAIAIGKAVADTAFYILDEQLQPVAKGESGELFISGVQVARGYYNRETSTAQKFIANPFSTEPNHDRLYRTGDLVREDNDGEVHFLSRTDNQIKLRGYRVELDEIRLAIEKHSWVKNAAVVVKNDDRTGFQNLVACVEFNSREAAFMDQGSHGEHHQSKKNKLQVKAQLSNAGLRTLTTQLRNEAIALPNATPSKGQLETVFARKTYRYFDGGDVQLDELLKLFSQQPELHGKRDIATLSFGEFGQIMRYFGQFKSSERLLPKYGYASPGALYATQLYVELQQLFDLDAGIYYYNPQDHQLHLIQALPETGQPALSLHFLGKPSAIEPVYKNNILEVLEMETGHMLGLFDQILGQYGLSVRDGYFNHQLNEVLAVEQDDCYLGSFTIAESKAEPLAQVEAILQVQGMNELADGTYTFDGQQFLPLSLDVIEKKHVIAINQQVYERASFGIALLNHSTETWRHYIDLGRKLQRLQMNSWYLGLMSSGYSSKSGHDLPSAIRMGDILAQTGKPMRPFYFCVGGKISHEQRASEGMKEDAIHMRGPLEILKDELEKSLPSFMVPNQIVVFDKLPQTANGKVDYIAIRASDKLETAGSNVPFVAARTPLEEKLSELWRATLKWDKVSVKDNFFESGGNSLTAVTLINAINKELNLTVPMQVLFQAPNIEELAHYIKHADHDSGNRLITLNQSQASSRVFCWPGLGGYPMSLKPLAEKLTPQAQFIGVQAHGINANEVPYETIAEMARADIKLLKEQQPQGPYQLWGYSFGARVAFEVAYQLEQQGDDVENLVLIAPGSPLLKNGQSRANEPSFDSSSFVTILFSVFFQRIDGPILERCLATVSSKADFIDFVCKNHRTLNRDMVKQIVEIVEQTYEFKYTFHELMERKVNAPTVIFKAKGDDYSFLENVSGFSEREIETVHLAEDHYEILKTDGVQALYQRYLQFQVSLTSDLLAQAS
ncbi:amino acid adenylation domain-containing protein [Pseudoalteromonas fenneropenaei]|uniref:Amino acid adenylation domain-containing protein n=1 Tax=Pseudoalteromonas fenneropenaei TaxID=1737459 RepID=A0ABV7CMD9_9GAMM